ncbi:uncharacterized protein P174DRAFT_270500 [Aspergillus novofumigatus IBT 16806]|uniref:Uncharacterized protein n=1 Tax=Aspergillus novofumigatus (strain IBT 16806) TaxID=1392255 RepID=A0A2I1BZ91_ASPN1|nr:uncharacterized protein P174DRAFT_270500 [Aspergillus novofumigatus IBT 16806]PKX90687.1 hypothetical protein P174DRAFT_270500 [Aspergillus novofumigatus IBT 16806]
MSNGLNWLKKLRRAEVNDLAHAAGLEDYADYSNKDALAVALHKYLQDNQTILINVPELKEYWTRASSTSPVRTSPVKKAVGVDVTPAPKKATPAARKATPGTTRRRQTQPKKEEAEVTDDSEASVASTPNQAASAVTKTPARSQITVEPPLSPALVTDAIDRQTAEWRERINDAWVRSGVQESSNWLRSKMSSVRAVETIVMAVEGAFLMKDLIPIRYLTTIPAVPAINSPEFALRVPDLFMLVDGAFWAPFSLWLLTSYLLPLLFAYFFNISLQASGNPAPETRKGHKTRPEFDPLSFNITKAVITYVVYAHHFNFMGLYSNFSIERVNVSVPFHWPGMLTTAAIGTVGTLYEAILRK